MALYAVVKRNPYNLKPGTFLELFDDGLQKVRFEMVGHRMKLLGHEGLIMPFDEMAPFIMRTLKSGLDKPDLRKYKF